jgi:hypothetical protein
LLTLFVCCGTAVPQPAMAHEIGTTRVTVRFPTDATFRIEVMTDAQALLEKLRTRSFLDRVVIRLDGHVITPSVETVIARPVDEASSSIATVTLTGQVPSDARQLTWNYGWTFSTYSLAFTQRDGRSRTQWLEGGEDSAPIQLTATLEAVSRASVVWQYLGLGFTHIIPKGLDHILFVLGLFLLSGRRSTLIWQVSAFTVAHTLTLGLAMNGIVAARPSIVEPLIALSIAYVAVENVFSVRLRPWRVALVFAFGLLHGLGFAGVLGELGLPPGQFIPALLAFNLGVEGGQLTVIAAAALAVGWWRTAPFYRQRIVVPASMAIACVAVYWTAQRLGY